MAERNLPTTISSIFSQMQTAVRRTEIVRDLYSQDTRSPRAEFKRRLFDPSRGARSEFVISEEDAASTAEKILQLRTDFIQLGIGPIEEDPEMNVFETSRFLIYGATGNINPRELLITGRLSEADITIEISFGNQQTASMQNITVDLRIDVLNEDMKTVTPYYSGTRQLTELTAEEHQVLTWCLGEIRAEANQVTEVIPKSA